MRLKPTRHIYHVYYTIATQAEVTFTFPVPHIEHNDDDGVLSVLKSHSKESFTNRPDMYEGDPNIHREKQSHTV